MLGNNMNFDMKSKMLDRLFRKVDGVVWDLSTGKIGLRKRDGIYTLQGEGEDAEVVINAFDNFGMEIPAFAQNTPIDAIKEGDLILGSGKKCLGWVIEKKPKSFTLMKPDGSRGSWKAPKVKMLGFEGADGAMVLRSLFNTLPDGGMGQMKGTLQMMAMMGMMDGDGSSLDKMIPMMLFMQTDESAKGMDMTTMLPMMLMAEALKGGSDPTPFTSSRRPARRTEANYFD